MKPKVFDFIGKSDKSEVTYKVPNLYCIEKRDINFISDVLCLINYTMVQNCWSNLFSYNEVRELWVSHETILLKQVAKVCNYIIAI